MDTTSIRRSIYTVMILPKLDWLCTVRKRFAQLTGTANELHFVTLSPTLCYQYRYKVRYSMFSAKHLADIFL